jgi:predicted lactoylglutathione lyase
VATGQQPDEIRGPYRSQPRDRPTTTRRRLHMPEAPIVIALPIADRQASFRFYGGGLGLETVGQPAEDGVPEPLQLALNSGLRVMLVPTRGFGWLTGDRKVTASGQSECVISISAGTDAGVDEMLERAREAGAEVVIEPGRQSWGYAGAFADPDGHVWMVTSDAAFWLTS